MGIPNRYYSSTATRTQLTGAISSTATLMPVASTTGMPDSTPFTLLLDGGTASEEIVTVTSISGLTLTVTRGEDGTTGAAHAIGCDVRHAATARAFREPQEHMAATADVHGVSGSLIGSNNSQTLSNKTLDASTRYIVGGTSISLDTALENAGGTGAGVVAFSIPGGLGTSVGTARIYNDTGKNLTFSLIRATAGTAPAGSAVIVDVNLNGVTIFTTQANRPTIAAGTNTDTATPDVTTWTAGSYLTVDVDQVGSTTAGSDLVVQVSAQ